MATSSKNYVVGLGLAVAFLVAANANAGLVTWAEAKPAGVVVGSTFDFGAGSWNATTGTTWTNAESGVSITNKDISVTLMTVDKSLFQNAVGFTLSWAGPVWGMNNANTTGETMLVGGQSVGYTGGNQTMFGWNGVVTSNEAYFAFAKDFDYSSDLGLEFIFPHGLNTAANTYTITFYGAVLPPTPGPAVPEPATLAMLGLGLAGLGVARRRMKK